MARDEYGIYRKPTGSIIAAWLGIAAAIFFGAYAFKMKDRLQQAQDNLHNAREEVNQMKLQMVSQLGELQALKAELQAHAPAIGAGSPTTPAATPALPALAPAAVLASQAEPAVPVAPAVAEPAKAATVRETAPLPAQTAGKAPAPAPEIPAGGRTELPSLPAESGEKAALNDATKLSGEILNYNPDTRKAIISLGSATSGLQPGSRFSVWRGDKYVTDIRVVTVYSVTSTCEVEGPTPIGVRTGDIARLASKPSGT